MSNLTSRDDALDEDLDDLPDGCGCVEIWTALSERRAMSEDDAAQDQIVCGGSSSS